MGTKSRNISTDTNRGVAISRNIPHTYMEELVPLTAGGEVKP